MIQQTKAFFCLWETWKRAGNGEWVEASKSLENFSSLVRRPVPSTKMPLEINILSLQIAFFDDQAEAALRAADVCVELLNSSEKSNKEKYLSHYIYKVVSACTHKFPSYGSKFQDILSNIALESFDIRRISSTIRSRAPL